MKSIQIYLCDYFSSNNNNLGHIHSLQYNRLLTGICTKVNITISFPENSPDAESWFHNDVLNVDFMDIFSPLSNQ